MQSSMRKKSKCCSISWLEGQIREGIVEGYFVGCIVGVFDFLQSVVDDGIAVGRGSCFMLFFFGTALDLSAPVGILVNFFVGALIGILVGFAVCICVFGFFLEGDDVGAAEGLDVGLFDFFLLYGASVGKFVGSFLLQWGVIDVVGDDDGWNEGCKVGIAVGSELDGVEVEDGINDGLTEGTDEGTKVGSTREGI